MKLYRLLTGADDTAFCARVERLLNEGWALHGSPAATGMPSQVIVVQAIVKEVSGDYSGLVHLDQLHPNNPI